MLEAPTASGLNWSTVIGSAGLSVLAIFGISVMLMMIVRVIQVRNIVGVIVRRKGGGKGVGLWHCDYTKVFMASAGGSFVGS